MNSLSHADEWYYVVEKSESEISEQECCDFIPSARKI